MIRAVMTTCCAIGLLCGMAGAQQVTVILEDSSGAMIAGGSVLAGCPSTTRVTDSAGIAFFPKLQAGECQITATAAELRQVATAVTVAEGVIVRLRMEPLIVRTALVVSVGQEVLGQASLAAHGDWNARQIAELVLSGGSTAFTDLITRTTPGVAADSNGFAHPLGEHADTSVILDGQPITDQQAKVFSNQLDPQIIETMTATTGAPPAEFGDKTSLIISLTTKSGLGREPFGSLSTELGSFGTASSSASFGAGGARWGNFFAISGGRSGRFLDSPEVRPMHDTGQHVSAFDRLDWQPRVQDAVHLNLMAGFSAFETPNSFDAALVGQRQRSKITNGNAALGWTHIVSPRLLSSVTVFYRGDRARYLPSGNPFADQPATLEQDRTLRNGGIRAELAGAGAGHSSKLGVQYLRTPLQERFSIGLTDPAFNAPCLDQPLAQARSAQECAAQHLTANPDFLASLMPYDLSRDGKLFRFDRSATISQAALYLQDDWKLRGFSFSAGLRYEIYNGLSRGRQLAPRLGAGWHATQTHTLLRASYARLYETPYNENLIFANDPAAGAENPFGSFRSEPVRPGERNQINVGLGQQLGKYLTMDADYYWKWTQTAFDFDTLFNTPVTFSVAWRKSKIDGLALRLNLLDFHGLTAYSVMGHVRSRFFGPQVGGVVFNSSPANGVFRIDHGEEFEHTSNLRYQARAGVIGKWRPWAALTWRYSSGLALPDTTPSYTEALLLTGDQQSQIGMRCGSDYATPTHAIRSCTEELFSASRIRIPAPGQQNDDRNPVRVAARNLFDLSLGEDALWKRERLTLGVRASVLNLTNQVALYNFLSTFSGTHFIAPRTVSAGVALRF